MIRWCAYCQRYMGEVAPFESYAITHGVCRHCIHLGRMSDRYYLQRIKAVAEFFTGLQGAVQAGKRVPAVAILAEGRRLGIRPTDLLVGIVQPLLAEIGEQRRRGEVTNEMEWQFTVTCEALVRDIGEQLAAPALPSDGRPDVLLASAAGNAHTFGLLFVELLLREAGLAAEVVAGGSSFAELVGLVRARRPLVLGVSVATDEQKVRLPELAEHLGQLPEGTRPAVLLGGAALKFNPRLPDGVTFPLAPSNPMELAELITIMLARQQAAAAGGEATLDDDSGYGL